MVVLVALVVLIVDQLTKVWAVASLEGQPAVNLAGEYLRLTFVRNSGAAFSLGAGSTIFISLIALVIVAVLIVRARHLRSVGWAIAMGGMIGGALGNLVDRAFREPGGLQGHVVDFIALPYWPVFNVADMAVVGSAILMVVLALMGIEFDGTRERSGSKGGDGSTSGGADGAPAEGTPVAGGTADGGAADRPATGGTAADDRATT